MMKTNRSNPIRHAACLAAACLIAVFFAAGCGASSGTSAAESSAAEPVSDAASPAAENRQEPVTLNVWYSASGATGKAFTQAAEAFDQSSDLVDLNLSYSGSSDDTAYKVNAAMIAGTQPDVALMYAGPVFTGGSGNYIMNDLIRRDGFNAGDIFPGLWDFCRYYTSGDICAVPYGISTQLIYYNKDIVKAAGADLTDPPKTWDAFLETLRVCAAASTDSRFAAFDAVQADWLFKTMLHQNGCPIINVNGDTVTPAFNDDAAKEAASFWKNLVDEGLMPAGEHELAEEKFLSGSLAFIAMSSNRIPRWKDAGIDIGAIPVPSFGKPSTAVGGTVLVILTTDPKRVEAAWDLISYLMEPEHHAAFALASGYLPVRQSELELPAVKTAIEENDLYRTAFEQLPATWAYTHFDEMGTLNLVIEEAMDAIERGAGTPDRCLDEAAEKLADEIAAGHA